MKKLNKPWWMIPLIAAGICSCTSDEDTPNNDFEQKPQTNYISIEEAQTELNKLLDDVYSTKSSCVSGLKSSGLKSSHRKTIADAYSISVNGEKTRTKSANAESIHVFNFENNEGFAIMSGNRALPSLIALADSGSLSENEEIDNPGVAIFLEGMEEEYSNSLKKVVSAGNQDGKVYGAWQNIIYKDRGYCKVKWGQWNPYNLYCPEVNGEKCPTGCAATAIAQLLSIYKYPQQQIGYYFNWDKMTEHESGDMCIGDIQRQIADLMKYIGTKENLDISYGIKGSSTATKNIPRVFKNLGYTNGGSLNNYNTTAIVDELKNGYPVIVNGFAGEKEVKKKVLFWYKTKKSYYDGHTWLCHGLLERRRNVKTYKNGKLQSTTTESEWYVLCNWGWDGNYDGYFLSNAFNPSEKPYKLDDGEDVPDNFSLSSYNFKYKNTAVTGIRK